MAARIEDLEIAEDIERMTDEQLREYIREKHREYEPKEITEADQCSCPDRLFR